MALLGKARCAVCFQFVDLELTMLAPSDSTRSRGSHTLHVFICVYASGPSECVHVRALMTM